MNYEQAFAILINPQHEGGYVNDPKDPGGETYKGVARKMNPTWEGWQRIDADRAYAGFPKNLEDDASLQMNVKSFYEVQYWGPAGCDAVPNTIKYELFDFAVNSSAPGHPTSAIKCLQRAAFCTDDGVLGPNTLQKVQSMDPTLLMCRFFAQVIRYYTGLRSDLKIAYLSGWMNRLATNLEQL